MSLLDRLLILIAALLVVAALVGLMKLDIGRNTTGLVHGITEQPSGPPR